MRHRTNWAMAAALLAAGVAGSGQTTIDLRTQVRNVDFSTAESTRPTKTGTALPATCQVGEEFFKNDAAPGQNKYGCTAPNTWTAMGSAAAIPGQAGNDFAVSTNQRGLTVMPGARTFGALRLASNTCAYTITAGTSNGVAYAYFTDSGQVVLEYPGGIGLTLSASGLDCQAAAITTPGWPTGLNFHPIATIPIVNGYWGAATQYPSLSAGWYAICAANLECTYSNGTVVLDTGADVMLLGGTNRVTGGLDLTEAQYFAIPRGASDAAGCTPGQQYFNTATGRVRVCTAPGAWADAAAGGGVSGGGLTAGEVVVGAGGSSVAAGGKTLPAGALVGDTDAQTLSQKTLQAPVFSGTAGGTLDLRQASGMLLPSAASDPGTCTPGQQYFRTGDARMRICAAANTWADVSPPAGAAAPGEVTARFWGANLAAGQKIATRLSRPCAIQEWTAWGDAAGTFAMDVRAASFADYPATVSITGTGTKPGVTAALKAMGSDFTGWSTAVLNAGDFVEFVVSGTPSGSGEAQVSLRCAE